MLLVLILLIGFCSFSVNNFFSLSNLDALLLAISTVGIISCTMLFCLASGNFDLSVGTVVPFAGVVAAVVSNKTDNTFLAVAAALGAGAAVGLVNGVVVAKAKINPLITTLATMQIVRGLAYWLANGKPISVMSDNFGQLGNAAFPKFVDASNHVVFQITVPVWICAASLILFGFILQWTTFGRNTLAIGGNEEAARLAGIKVDRVKIVIFAVQGIVAAMAGVLLAARLSLGAPKSSEGLELQVISACVLGGVSLTGGIGKISFVIAGVLIMGVVNNAMTLKGMDYYYQYVVSGAILLAAVLFDRFKPRRRN